MDVSQVRLVRRADAPACREPIASGLGVLCQLVGHAQEVILWPHPDGRVALVPVRG